MVPRVSLEQSKKSCGDVKLSMTRYPKSLLTGTFLIMLLSPRLPIVLNDPRLGEEMKMFLMPSKSNIPNTKGLLNCRLM